MNSYFTQNIISTIIKNKKSILVIVSLLTVCFGFSIFNIEVNNDPTETVPSNLKELKNYNRLQDVFSSPRSIIFIAEFGKKQNLEEKIDSVVEWADRYSEVKGITGVLHLGAVRIPAPGGFFGLKSRELITPSIKKSEEKIRKEISRYKDFTKVLISEDESVLSMIMYLDENMNQVDVVKKVVDIFNRMKEKTSANLHITGAPLYTYNIDRSMKRDFAILLPVCLVVIFFLLYWVFNRMYHVIISLLITVLALIWTFGLMGLTGMTFSVVTSMVPVILFPIGVASAIHVFKTFSRNYAEGKTEGEKVIQLTFIELLNPIFLSAVTTFVGFASFGFSRMEWTRTFGIFAGTGVALALFLSILLLPIFLSIDKNKHLKLDNKSRLAFSRRSRRFKVRYRNFILSPYKWIFVSAVIIGVGIFGLLRIRIEGNPITMFPDSSDLVKSDSIISSHLGGTRFLYIMLEKKNGDFMQKEDWKEVQEIERIVAKNDMIGGVTSLLPLIKMTSSLVSEDEISSAAISLLLKGKGILGKKFGNYIRSWVSPEKDKIRMTLLCRNVSGTRFIEFSRSIEKEIESKYPGMQVTAAGPPVLNDAMTFVLINTQITSLLIAFLAVFLVLCMLFRSFKIGVFAIIPIIFSTIFVYSLMGFFNIAINYVTVIIVNTCIGIGIDYSIHFISGYRFNLERMDGNLAAIVETVKNKGSVIIFNTMVVGIGFLVLTFSSFPPIRHFGVFVFVSMLSSSTFSLLFLPVFFYFFSGKRNFKININRGEKDD